METSPETPTFWTRYQLHVYAIPRLGGSLLLTLQAFVITFLYSQVYGLSGILTGVNTGLGFLSIAAAQFLMSWWSDRTNTRWGRRRPFVLFGTPFLTVSFFLLFTPPLFLGAAPGQNSLFTWMLVWNCTFEFFYGLVTGPYQAMLPEITVQPQRPRASQLQNIYSYIGIGIGVVLTLLGITKLTDEIQATGNLNAPFIIIFLACAAGMACTFYIFTSKMTPEKPQFVAREPLLPNLKEVIHNKNFLRISLFIGIVNIAVSMIVSLILGFVKEVFHLMTSYISLGSFHLPYYYLAAVILIVGILSFLAVWRRLVEKRGKKTTLQVVLVFGICFLPFTLLGYIQSNDMGLVGVFLVLALTSFLGGYYLFPYILYADFAEDDVRRTNNFKAGLYGGFPPIFINLFQALTAFVIIGPLIDKSL